MPRVHVPITYTHCGTSYTEEHRAGMQQLVLGWDKTEEATPKLVSVGYTQHGRKPQPHDLLKNVTSRSECWVVFQERNNVKFVF